MSAWSFEHSVDVAVEPEVAWHFWTNVANWRFDPSLEWVTLEPGFVAGAKGVTKPRGADPIVWSIPHTGKGDATIEMLFPGALVTFQWTFRPAGTGRTRITQAVTLSGPQANDYTGLAESQLAEGIPQGMRKLAQEIERASG